MFSLLLARRRINLAKRSPHETERRKRAVSSAYPRRGKLAVSCRKLSASTMNCRSFIPSSHGLEHSEDDVDNWLLNIS